MRHLAALIDEILSCNRKKQDAAERKTNAAECRVKRAFEGAGWCVYEAGPKPSEDKS